MHCGRSQWSTQTHSLIADGSVMVLVVRHDDGAVYQQLPHSIAVLIQFWMGILPFK